MHDPQHEAPRDQTLADFEPHLGCSTKGKAFGGIPLPNTLGGPQYHPQPQALHFAVGRVPPAMVERGKLDHIEERLRAIKWGGNYAFADMAELCLVLENHLKKYCRKMGAYAKDEKLLMHFFQESLTGVVVT